jgi:predicted dehydrogenase
VRMEKIGIGVIGTGGIANGVHLPGILSSADGRIAALCDIDAGRLEQTADRYGIAPRRRFSDYRELIACEDVRAVDVCTPNHLHAEMALEAIRRGKPVCVEKPLAMSLREAENIRGAVHADGVPFMVCFSYRFRPAVRFAHWIISQGYLGDVVNVYVRYLKSSAFWEGRRLEWRFVKAYAGSGVLGDLGSHLIDMAMFLLGDFKGVFAQTGIAVKRRMRLESDEWADVETDDYCHFLAQLSCGAAASFNITRCATGNENSVQFEIYGTKGAIRFDLDQPEILSVCIGDIDRRTQGMHAVKAPREFHTSQTQAFLDLVKGTGDGLSPSIDDGVKCQRIIDALLDSDAARKWVGIG